MNNQHNIQDFSLRGGGGNSTFGFWRECDRLRPEKEKKGLQLDNERFYEWKADFYMAEQTPIFCQPCPFYDNAN